MIYVTLGTMFMDFPRLVRAMDTVARDTGEQVVIQLGLSKTFPLHAAYFDFLPHDEVLALQKHARLVVAHAGIGVTVDALNLGRPLLLVPRLHRFGEHMNDHQLDLARAVERRGWGRMVLDMDELPGLCAAPPPAPHAYRPAKDALIAAVRAGVEHVARGERP